MLQPEREVSLYGFLKTETLLLISQEVPLKLDLILIFRVQDRQGRHQETLAMEGIASLQKQTMEV